MPELPEVETVRMGLEKYLTGHTIERVEVRFRKTLKEGESSLVGGKIEKVRRFGKVLVIDLNNRYSILMHLKLTGQPIYRGPKLKNAPQISKKVVGGVPGKHTHVIFHLDRGGKLYFNDYRKFGWIRVVPTKEVEETSFIKKLGPEPHVAKGFAGQALTLEIFRDILSKSSRPIKIILMDQEKIGGVGNIYANEALWWAKVNPKRPAQNLNEAEMEKLFQAILKVLKEAIEYGGSSDVAYVTPEGGEGSYQQHFVAYDRKGEFCSRCKKAKIEKITLGGRGTYFCPHCQNDK